MGRRRTYLLLFAATVAALLLCAPRVFAQAAPQAPKAEAVEDRPAEPAKSGFVTSVAVVNDSTDQLGTRLAFRLKETLNASSLFALSAKDERKIKVILTTQPEFPGREQVGSVYAAVWIYAADETVLTHYLASEVGTVDAATVDAAAQALAGRTAAVAEKYAYLFE
jgi:hypothetical protein